MLHDNVVLRAFCTELRRERDILARREDAVGKWEIEDWGLVKRKDVVRTVLQSGPLRLRAEEDRIVETLC